MHLPLIEGRWRRHTSKTRYVSGLIAVIAVVSALYRLIYFTGQWKSAALFVFLPALVALAITTSPARLIPQRKDWAVTEVGATVVIMLIFMTILPEGVVCWLMAMPLVLLVVAIVMGLRNVATKNRTSVMIALPLLLLVSAEGILVGDVINPNNHSEAHVVVDMTETELLTNLAESPDIVSDLPWFFRLEFPVPTAIEGSGLEVGDQRTITFAGPNTTGAPEPASMTIEVAARTQNSIEFDVVENTSMYGEWVEITSSSVRWDPTADGLAVTWSIDHQRQMHPGWYFDPLQNFAMDQAVEHLLEASVAPR